MNLVRATASIGGLTLVSRVLGMVRDMLMARYVGAGLASDAFLIAWRLPNLFRALFAEGAFAAVFVPMYNRRMTQAEQEAAESGLAAANEFAGQVLSVLLPFLILFTAIMMAATAQIVWAMTGGFPDGGPEKFDLAVHLTRITFPYLALISLVSLLGGILNSLNRFWVNAAAPVLLNIAMIVAILFFRGTSQAQIAETQAIAVTAAGALQLLWLVWSCRRAGVVLKLARPRLSPDVKRLLLLIGPAALGQGAIQFNLLISTSLAARFLEQGAVSYLYYADRLNQLPLGLIGIGVGTAILPTLSRQIGGEDHKAAAHTQNRAMELSLLLALPAAVALVVSATPLVRGVFQHGAFTAADTLGASGALAAFSLGVPAYVLIKVLTPGFYARQDTKTPVRLAVVSMLVNLAGNLLSVLVLDAGFTGIALSTALAAWVNFALLYAWLHRRNHLQLDARFKAKALRIIAASTAMGAALFALNPWLDPFMAGGWQERVTALVALCGIGGAVYGVAVLLLGGASLGELRRQFTRKA
ncbi:murein biosynthesis integral membrane protein MurJ [Sphingomonas sp. SUN039]|uniref:murein biosynthesis integral membrane protein MurJ n=1 Tax=Sphingomonas sp. SUN039 TaxID=2937787 RepID=UPI002164B2B8|nr:murein biosynthesis integral membrane protein MurJ [Sphingomonas sp. SUN039]UVO53028.1 murein biosynthesis integral membrane protein MurJ [Sphingomonas sp. SUN039]